MQWPLNHVAQQLLDWGMMEDINIIVPQFTMCIPLFTIKINE